MALRTFGEKNLLINELVDKYGITLRTIRYYEEYGLLNPTRNSSNIRVFSQTDVEKLELILLLKLIGFKLREVKNILKTDNSIILNKRLNARLTELDIEFNGLYKKRKLVLSVIDAFGNSNADKIKLPHKIDSRLYLNAKNERMLLMLSKTNDLIIELGKNLIPCAMGENSCIISFIRQLRQEIQTKFNVLLEQVRIMDNIEALSENEYRILQNDIVLIQKCVVASDINLQSEHIISNLKALVI